jgi:peptidoglycan/LPS O-acetylase OafA/YrhL
VAVTANNNIAFEAIRPYSATQSGASMTDLTTTATKKAIMNHGNLILLFGMMGSCISSYLFFHYHYSFLMTAFGYSLQAMSFAALTLAALSPSSYLHQVKIPGAAPLALWSYAIYLVHKPLMVLTDKALLNLEITHSSLTALVTISASILGGWILYLCVEVPFLKFRDRTAKTRLVPSVIFSLR